MCEADRSTSTAARGRPNSGDVGSLQLHEHSASELRLLLPLCLGASAALGRHEPRLLGRRLLSLHLSHATLPAGLARLLRDAAFGQARAAGPWVGFGSGSSV